MTDEQRGGRRISHDRKVPARWQRRLVAGGIVAVLFGAVAATLVARSYDGVYSEPNETAISSDRIDTAVAALEDQHVYVAPDGRYLMDVDAQERLEEKLQTVEQDDDVPVYAVVWAPTVDAGYDPADGSVIAAQITVGLDEDALVVIWEGPGMALHNLEVGNGRDGIVAEGDAALRISEFADRAEPDDVPDQPALDVGSDPTAAVVLGVTLALLAYAALLGVLGIARVAFGRPFLIPGPWRRR